MSLGMHVFEVLVSTLLVLGFVVALIRTQPYIESDKHWKLPTKLLALLVTAAAMCLNSVSVANARLDDDPDAVAVEAIAYVVVALCALLCIVLFLSFFRYIASVASKHKKNMEMRKQKAQNKTLRRRGEESFTWSKNPIIKYVPRIPRYCESY